MPFSGTTPLRTKQYWDTHFERISPAIEDVGLAPRRSSALRGSLLSQIITSLASSPVVVADLTDRNCNVYWELGVRQSLRPGTVVIADIDSELAFDVKDIGVHFYDPTSAKIEWESFRREFKRALKDCIDNPQIPDSPVLEAISGRGSLYSIFRGEEIIRRLTGLLSEIDRNFGLIELANKYAENAIEGVKRSFLTTKCRVASTESLLGERYVDESNEFYRIAEDYYDTIVRFNERLNLWHDLPPSTDKWIVNRSENWLGVVESFRARVAAVMKTLGG